MPLIRTEYDVAILSKCSKDYGQSCGKKYLTRRICSRTQMVEQRINSEVQMKVLCETMTSPLDVSPSKGNQRTTRGKDKMFLTSVGIEPTTSRLDLPLIQPPKCR